MCVAYYFEFFPINFHCFQLSFSMAASKTSSSRPALQLIAFTADKINFYYGEFHDDHILRGSSRSLYASNVKIVEMSAGWKTYLTGRVVEIEQPGSKWVKATLEAGGIKYMLRHDSGYVIPLICVRSYAFYEYFPRMAESVPVAIPTQTVRPPGIVAGSAAAPAMTSKPKKPLRMLPRVDDDAYAVCNGDDDDLSLVDDGKKERDALSAAIELMMRNTKPKSIASKVMFK